jgi:hypothetical protein
MEKAEGDRSTAEENMRNAERSRATGFDDDGDDAGGMTNRSPDIIAPHENRRDTTPRRYEQPVDDKAMPENDSTLKTKI